VILFPTFGFFGIGGCPFTLLFFGGDPRNNTWDIGSDSLAFAKERLGIIRELRSTLLEKQVKEGESWRQARRRLGMLTGVQLQALRHASVWIGGSFINNNFKGDPDERPPNTDVPSSTQREALQLMMANSFEDDAYGITPELLRHLGREYWWDPLERRGCHRPPVTSNIAIRSDPSTLELDIMSITTARRVATHLRSGMRRFRGGIWTRASPIRRSDRC